jgi:pimeloyl-ACP methyl ester carboxylesterase
MKKYEKLYEQKIPSANLNKYKKERIIYRFKDVHMDLNVMHLLWQQSGGGTDTAEIWAATSRMKKKDRESWNREFAVQGERLEEMARESFKAGHLISAKEAYFRASCYYGTAGKREKQVSCFRIAGEMVVPALEPVEIPFEGKHLPGYFVKAVADNEKKKTLIFIGGGDTILEDLYFIAGNAGKIRGYNVFVVEMPGQGATVLNGMFMRPDTEVPMKAIVDYVLSRPDVDPEKLAAMGLSWGGYMVPRAACFEKRLKAIVANSIIPDGNIWMTEISPFGTIAKLENTIFFSLIKLILGSRMMPRLESLKKKWGARDMKHFVELNKEFYLDPRMIECPTLLLDGATENIFSRGVEILQEVALEAISHPKKKRITGPKELGADGHCQVVNTNFMNRVTFDWLDEVFEKAAIKTSHYSFFVI